MLFLSRIHLGISYGMNLPESKVSHLKRMESLYSLDFFITNDPECEIKPSWGNIDGSFVYLVSNKKGVLPKLSNYSWLVVFLNVGGESSCGTQDTLQIEKLEELILTMCRLNKRSIGLNAVTVGNKMKPSCVEDFAKRDRLEIQNILLSLVELNAEGSCTIRGPHFLKVDNFDDLNFATELTKAKLSFPCMVKPKVACGVSNAHKRQLFSELMI
ncbi:inositol 1,3,4-trisphosphate 5/6-kinase 4 [Senna tora]|uniref:Inositol 1,3,4-trisphosphate 5/6-kinase 4 n=1 Tax=Senna tora TaxID=362788 RepID=A0A834WX13_9FABA|nr:inositol 1,3,4-trisphosphate 5/6-kinase 4 [Senna tora]